MINLEKLVELEFRVRLRDCVLNCVSYDILWFYTTIKKIEFN